VRRRVLLRPEAERDLDGQADCIAREHSLEAALRFYAAVEDTLALLVVQPRMGTARRFRKPLLAGVRVCVVKGWDKHLIFYRPLQHAIDVLRILHGARDIERLFK
jgi:toxin ParE1/3/4